jgi:putative tryptophan/tyrosine transport system substrate-binding protein
MKAMLLVVAALAACGWHANASAQAKVPRVGVFSQKALGAQPFFQAFERYLAERGWTNGKNVVLDYRPILMDPKELSKVAEEFVRLKVDVIHASAAPLLRAAYSATHAIPIVGLDFTNDPVAVGYAESYSRPGRNVTGIFLDAPELAGKWLQILRELKPGLSRVGVLWERGPGPAHLRALESAAKAFKVELKIVEVRKVDEFEQAVGAVAATDALIVLPSPFFYGHSAHLAELIRERKLLAIAIWRSFGEAGGAVSFGPDLMESAERMAHMTAKILGGAKAGDIPIERPAKFEFVINQKTLKLLGLPVPDALLLRADEVIR